MTDFAQQLKHLQKLSCISLSPEEEKKLGSQLNDIIGFLGQLPDTKVQSSKGNEMESRKAGQKVQSQKLTLRTIKGVKESTESKKILNNVKHPIINNSIVIKSVLN